MLLGFCFIAAKKPKIYTTTMQIMRKCVYGHISNMFHCCKNLFITYFLLKNTFLSPPKKLEDSNKGGGCCLGERMLVGMPLIIADAAHQGLLRLIYLFIRLFQDKDISEWTRFKCDNCRVHFKKLKLCKGCRNVRYCSRECQKISWNNVHRYHCRKDSPQIIYIHGNR